MKRALLCLLLLWRCALADIESSEVRAGMAAWDKGDAPRAVEILTRALAESLTREEKLAALEALANAEAALGQKDAARTHFEALSRLRPALREVQPSFDPAHPREGEAVRVQTSHPGGLAQRASIFYRKSGDSGFSRLEVREREGRFDAVVPGEVVRPPALELHLLLLDESGLSIARAGSLAEPLTLPVTARPRPVYRRGWFWGTLAGSAAAVLIVGVAVGVATAGKPVHLVVQPQ